jgi:predicted RNase H-like nuclease (RuvC/YqgF family)
VYKVKEVSETPAEEKPRQDQGEVEKLRVALVQKEKEIYNLKRMLDNQDKQISALERDRVQRERAGNSESLQDQVIQLTA